MGELIIMRGLPGSGKSTLAREIQSQSDGPTVILSTDSYWIRPDGRYDFNGRLLKEAHDWNFNCFKKSLNAGYRLVIIDNTNISYAAYEKYIDLAEKHGWTWRIVEPNNSWSKDPEGCAAKTIHNVSVDIIKRMSANWQD